MLEIINHSACEFLNRNIGTTLALLEELRQIFLTPLPTEKGRGTYVTALFLFFVLGDNITEDGTQHLRSGYISEEMIFQHKGVDYFFLIHKLGMNFAETDTD